jgi:sugar phosphate isomerase/epimerase
MWTEAETMRPWLVLPSTTSHKKEALETTLEVFSRLGMRDLDLNLHHMIELGTPVQALRDALAAGGHKVWIASGGWCDFYDGAPRIEMTFDSVHRQVVLTRALAVDRLRLFFGRLHRREYTADARAVIASNMRRLSDAYPDLLFVFENHDGASLDPSVCREILETVDRPNVRMNFDPVNFERAGVASMEAFRILQPLIEHVHLKGAVGTECCEFGSGDVDLRPVLRALAAAGYRGGFTVEYEGLFDRTLRLYEGVRRARAAVEELAESLTQ